MALQLPVPPPAPEVYHLAEPRIRRCTFRRLISVESTERIYDVECLYPERRVPIPLGDLESTLPNCNPCTAAHIFRPDDDYGRPRMRASEPACKPSSIPRLLPMPANHLTPPNTPRF